MNSIIKEEDSDNSSSSNESIKIKKVNRKTSKPGLIRLDSGELPRKKFSGGIDLSMSRPNHEKNSRLTG